MLFEEKDIFVTEILTEPSSPGEYRVDYNNAKVENYSIASGLRSCSYHSDIFPLEVDSTPIEIYTFQDDDYQDELFDKKTLDSGEEVNALPNTEGAKTYHQLFLGTEVFWGR